MHVALVCPAWPPEHSANGIVTYVRWMRSGLMAHGCRVSIFAFALDAVAGDTDVHLIPSTRTSRLARGVKKLFGQQSSVFDGGELIARALLEVHATTPIDVVEMEESFGWVSAVHERTGLPVVAKLHGPAFLHLVDEERATAFGQEKIRREGIALRGIEVITSPSRGHLDDTLGFYGLRPAVGEHVVNPLALRADDELWKLGTRDKDLILFVGRFDKIKGGDVVIRVFQKLRRHHASLRLAFVGPDRGLIQDDGSLIGIHEYLKSLGDPLLERSVEIHGRLAPVKISQMRVRAACVLVASARESQGYTALEAMLQGCPVVCTNASGLTESVQDGDTGLKAAIGDVDGLAEKVEMVLDDPSLAARLGARAREYVLATHDPAAVASATLSIYLRAIELAKRRRDPVRGSS